MLAIVIPFYKIKFFEECLASLSNQTNHNFKVYIGNDNSPDDPVEIIKKFRPVLNLTYVPFKENLGQVSLVKHWQRCIDLVQDEEWLMIFGDDDKLDNECVANFYHYLPEIIKKGVTAVRFATIRIDAKGTERSKKFFHPEIENSIDFLFKKLKGETRSSLSEYIFRKKEVTEVKFKEFPLGWHTDDLAVMEFSNFGNVFTINQGVAYFRYSGINISSLSDNIIDKNKASFLFYYYLLLKKKSHFSDVQVQYLDCKIQKCYHNDKKNVEFLLKFNYLFMRRMKIKKVLNFYWNVLKGRNWEN